MMELTVRKSLFHYTGYTFEGSWGRDSRQKLKLTGLLPLTCSAPLFIGQRSTCPGVVLLAVGLALLYQLAINENAPWTCLHTQVRKPVPHLSFSLPRYVEVCIKLKKELWQPRITRTLTGFVISPNWCIILFMTALSTLEDYHIYYDSSRYTPSSVYAVEWHSPFPRVHLPVFSSIPGIIHQFLSTWIALLIFYQFQFDRLL